MKIEIRQIEDRQNIIGGSDIGSLLGLNNWCSPSKLYGLKTGIIEPDPANILMIMGKHAEPKIAELYAEQH